MSKVAIIGAGPCGLSMLRAFEHLENKGEKTPSRVSFCLVSCSSAPVVFPAEIQACT